MAGNHTEIEKRLWDAADELRANSKLKSSEYSTPVLGLIFLRYADHKFTHAQQELEGRAPSRPQSLVGSDSVSDMRAGRRADRPSRRTIGKTDYHTRGVLHPPEVARFANLRRTRDLLLPKLISGEVDVTELGVETNT